MPKIFFMCTHANQGSGYGRVANKITNYLASLPTVKVVFYAFQNYPTTVNDRFIDPRIKFIDAVKEDPVSPKGFGDKAIIKHFQIENPDILFIYNDISVCTSILMLLEPYNTSKTYIYLDLVYPWEDIKRFNYIKEKTDVCILFSNYWKEHMLELGWQAKKLKVLMHGIDSKRFTKIPNYIAKEQLGFDKKDFLVLNMNRNSYRKQWDVTLKAFLEFLYHNNFNKHIKLFIGCKLNCETGYDILKLIKTICLKNKYNTANILNNHVFINPKPSFANDDYINLIYNACDVGLNTCCGEGFGLTNLEHRSLGKQQIVSGIPAIKSALQLCKNGIIYIEPKVWSTISNFESHGGEIAHFDPNDFAKALEQVYHDINTYTYKNDIGKCYNWNQFLPKLRKM